MVVTFFHKLRSRKEFSRTEKIENRMPPHTSKIFSAIEKPEYCLSSIGGVSSSVLFDFLASKLKHSTENRFPQGQSKWKHSLYPPISPSLKKAIFVFGDPRIAVLSIIRRDISMLHLKNKGLPHYRFTLEELLEQKLDPLRTYEHMNNWFSGSRQYPIFCVSAENIESSFLDICKFFEIKVADSEEIPTIKKQKSLEVFDALPSTDQSRLNDILREATDLFKEAKPAFIVPRLK